MEKVQQYILDSEREFNHSTQIQAENMAQFSNIELGSEEIHFYIALHELKSSPSENHSEETNTPKDRAWQLSDQELLAIVLDKSGDQVRLRQLMTAYPKIFPSK
jgi:hypothetical protein